MEKKKSALDLVHITPGRVAELKQEINYLEKMLKDDKSSKSPKIQDEVEFVAQIKKRKHELKNHMPAKLEGQQANKAYELAKKLKVYIQNRMPSKKAYFQKQIRDSDGHSKHRDFEDAVNQQIAFQTDPKIQKAVRAYKHIMSRLDPNDPRIRNIEMLRK